MGATPTELSIAFSAAELAVLTGLLGLPAAVGPSRPVDVGGRVAGPGEIRPAATDAAGSSLRDRGVVGHDDDAVALPVAELLRIACAPQVSIDVEIVGVGPARRHRYALSGPAGIEQTFDDGLSRFTPFAAVEVLVRLADVTGLWADDGAAPAGDGAAPAGDAADTDAASPVWPVAIRRDALLAAARGTAAGRVAAELMAGGVAARQAASVAELIVQRQATVSIRVRRRTGPGRVEGGDVGWLATPRGPVSWPVRTAGTDPWTGDGGTVTVQPLPARALLADLADAIAGAPVAGGR